MSPSPPPPFLRKGVTRVRGLAARSDQWIATPWDGPAKSL